jgi:hypothetical protein
MAHDRETLDSYLHKPIIIVVKIAWVAIVDLDDGNKVFTRHENFVITKEYRGQIDAPLLEVSLKF